MFRKIKNYFYDEKPLTWGWYRRTYLKSFVGSAALLAVMCLYEKAMESQEYRSDITWNYVPNDNDEEETEN